jgi:hypothetical protein
MQTPAYWLAKVEEHALALDERDYLITQIPTLLAS